MVVILRNNLSIPLEIKKNIINTITESLNDIETDRNKFIINDTLWQTKNRKGKYSPCVVNEAGFISKTFQKNLERYPGWHGETQIDGQNIDGYAELIFPDDIYTTYQLEKEKFLVFLQEFLEFNGLPEYYISKYFAIFYGMYINRDFFTLEFIPKKLHKYFIQVNVLKQNNMRIGIEFETGNTASAYRAFFKLNSLYSKGLIDIGIFITSVDKKNCATRIWPMSNRNGSFEELENRNYDDNINLPLFEFAFQPDSFSKESAYLKDDCSLYFPKKTDETIIIDGKIYEVYLGSNGDKIIKR